MYVAFELIDVECTSLNKDCDMTICWMMWNFQRIFKNFWIKFEIFARKNFDFCSNSRILQNLRADFLQNFFPKWLNAINCVPAIPQISAEESPMPNFIQNAAESANWWKNFRNSRPRAISSMFVLWKEFPFERDWRPKENFDFPTKPNTKIRIRSRIGSRPNAAKKFTKCSEERRRSESRSRNLIEIPGEKISDWAKFGRNSMKAPNRTRIEKNFWANFRPNFIRRNRRSLCNQSPKINYRKDAREFQKIRWRTNVGLRK